MKTYPPTLALALLFGCLIVPRTRGQNDTVTISAEEFRQMTYGGHLRTQFEAKPELEATVKVLLELQRRNPNANPTALAGICQQALARYRTNSPARFLPVPLPDEILAAYLLELQALPGSTNFIPATLSLLKQLITRSDAAAGVAQADLFNSGTQRLLVAEDAAGRQETLVDTCVRRAGQNAAFAQALESLCLPETLISLQDSGVDIINNTNSPLSESPTMHVLRDLSVASADGSVTISTNQLKNLFTAEMQALHQIINTNLAVALEISRNQRDLLAYLDPGDPAARDADAAREDAVKQGQSRRIAAANSAIAIQARLVEAKDPPFGIDLGKAGSVVSSVAKAMELFSKKDGGSLVTAAATGNLLAAGLTAFSMFDSGPSVDEVILEEIGQVKSMIHKLSVQVDFRFDRVDMGLNQILQTLDENFEKIDFVLGTISGDLDEIRLDLLDIQTSINRLERNVAAFIGLTFRNDLIQNVNLVLDYEAQTSRLLPFDDFFAAQSFFHTYATFTATQEPLAFGDSLPTSDMDLYSQLSPALSPNVYAEMLNYIKKILRVRLGLPGFDASPLLVNPQDWNVAVNAWLQLAVENPMHFRGLPGAPGRLDGMIIAGQQVAAFHRSLTLTGTGANLQINTALYNALLANYATKYADVLSEISDVEQVFAQQNSFLLNTWRQWNAAAPRVAGPATALSPPMPAAFPIRPRLIAAGENHNLAILRNGTPIGWGNNFAGQASFPASATNVAAIAAGGSHSLALRADGSVIGWGQNHAGQSTIPLSATNVAAIAAGLVNSLALRSNGTVIAWGDNFFGQNNVPADATNVVAISAGGLHHLALRADGRVLAWGSDGTGQTTIPASATNVVAIAAGGSHSLALRSDGTVIGWGYNISGQATGVPTPFPHVSSGMVSVGGQPLSNVVAIAAGGSHSLALRANRTVIGWGANDRGQINIPALPDYVGIDAGGSHTLLVRWDGTIDGYGANQFGQTTIPTIPAPASDRVVAIAGTANVYMALLSDRTVVTWGNNINGELDIPAAATNIVAIDGGHSHCLALRGDGTVVAWGNNGSGQINIPASATDVVSIAAGPVHNLALREDGTIVGWGYNGEGQATGVPTQNHPFISAGVVTVEGFPLNDVVAIAAGSDSSMAILADGTVIAWGSGPATNTPANLTNVVAIACGRESPLGYQHNLALHANGRVTEWGGNVFSTVPTSATNVVAIAKIYDFGLALRADGTVIYWHRGLGGDQNYPPLATNVVAMRGHSPSFGFFVIKAPQAGDAPTPLFVRAQIPERVRRLLQASRAEVLADVTAPSPLRDATVVLSGAKALIKAVLEFGLPRTLEADDVLNGFLNGSESLPDIGNLGGMIQSEIDLLETNPNANPRPYTEEGALRLIRFQERLNTALASLLQNRQPENPRLVDQTLRLLTLLRNAWAATPPRPSLEITGRQPGSFSITLYGEPHAHHTLQTIMNLSSAGVWTSTSLTNIQDGRTVNVPIFGPGNLFIRARLPVP